ncbi:MAG: FAD-dependent oxidoreductase, partial [Gammaproteobacteria bacterium]|nr:FAD-dependent oxidoreductase [Gammaproteobacteria bacterium]
ARLTEWDYVVIGAGITGIQTFRILSSEGFRVLLIDSADFTSATSSNSGMLIWGGILYLKSLDFISVFKFSKSRDHLIKTDPGNVKVLGVTYLSDRKKIRTRLVLLFYWLFSLFRRRRPYNISCAAEQGLYKKEYTSVNVFEEALIHSSDSRYAIDMLMSSLNSCEQSRAFNYLSLVKGEYTGSGWVLSLENKIQNESFKIMTKNLINCTGVYVDEVNQYLGINASPYRHLWSKGMYFNLQRKNNHDNMIVFDDPVNEDVLTYCPFGDVSLFGPTEDNVDNDRSAGFKLTAEDIRKLKQKYENYTGEKLHRKHLISYRVGVRPLCVPNGFSDAGYTLGISRNSKTYHLAEKNFSAVYGGKFTGSYELAVKTVKDFGITAKPDEENIFPYWKNFESRVNYIRPEMALLAEQCWTLKDYLRHRTFIHQSVANGGFGLNFEFRQQIETISGCFLDQLASTDVSAKAYFEEQRAINDLFRAELDGD